VTFPFEQTNMKNSGVFTLVVAGSSYPFLSIVDLTYSGASYQVFYHLTGTSAIRSDLGVYLGVCNKGAYYFPLYKDIEWDAWYVADKLALAVDEAEELVKEMTKLRRALDDCASV